MIELKDILSAYLREMKRGARAPGVDPVLDGWARTGQVTMPTRAKEPMPDSPVVLPKGSARRLRFGLIPFRT